MEVLLFAVNAVLLGVGLAMDTFSVGMVNGLNEPDMKPGRMCLISGVYSFFQFFFPLVGWVFVHLLISYFYVLSNLVPWVGFAVLLFVGIKMLAEYFAERKKSAKGGDEKDCAGGKEIKKISFGVLVLQGIATAIDAFSVGLTIADLKPLPAVLECLIVGFVTFIISFLGIYLGRKGSSRFASKAPVLGGVILICIGIEILVKGVFL